MASKKLTLLFGLLCLLLSSRTARSARVMMCGTPLLFPPDASLSTMNFLNNAYPFPAKPRNEWELGVKGGYTTGFTDVHNWGPTGGFGVHLRKAWDMSSP